MGILQCLTIAFKTTSLGRRTNFASKLAESAPDQQTASNDTDSDTMIPSPGAFSFSSL